MNNQLPNPADLTDEQLRIAHAAARARADRLLKKSRRAGPSQWSALAQASNRAVAEFLALDAEVNFREAIRIAEPVIETDIPDPLPYWLFWSIMAVGAIATLVLWAKTA